MFMQKYSENYLLNEIVDKSNCLPVGLQPTSRFTICVLLENIKEYSFRSAYFLFVLRSLSTAGLTEVEISKKKIGVSHSKVKKAAVHLKVRTAPLGLMASWDLLAATNYFLLSFYYTHVSLGRLSKRRGSTVYIRLPEVRHLWDSSATRAIKRGRRVYKKDAVRVQMKIDAFGCAYKEDIHEYIYRQLIEKPNEISSY